MQLRNEVRSNLESALENGYDDVLSRDPKEIAEEMIEYTSCEGTGEDIVKYVEEWQKEQKR